MNYNSQLLYYFVFVHKIIFIYWVDIFNKVFLYMFFFKTQHTSPVLKDGSFNFIIVFLKTFIVQSGIVIGIQNYITFHYITWLQYLHRISVGDFAPIIYELF